jgi:hypothetical protein
MDLKKLIDEIAQVASTAAIVLPGAGIVGGAARIGSKLIEVIEDLHPHAPDAESAGKLETAHDQLTAIVTRKSGDLSNRLRGH